MIYKIGFVGCESEKEALDFVSKMRAEHGPEMLISMMTKTVTTPHGRLIPAHDVELDAANLIHVRIEKGILNKRAECNHTN